MNVLACISWLAVLSGLAAVPLAYTAVERRQTRRRELMLKRCEGRRKALSDESAKLSRFENGMKEKELAIAGLYEITKKMSEKLKFDDMFAVFGSFLKENFKFRKADLLALNWDEGAARVEKVYSVWRDEKEATSHIVNYDRIMKLFLDTPKEVYASRDGERRVFEDLGIAEDERIRTFAGLPLLSGKRAAAILTIENLPREELEELVISALQFLLEMKKALLYETVERLAITDSLTGLYVRRYFSERAAEEAKRSKRHKFNFAFLLFDIDDFKRANDTYGHLVGDVVLKEIGRIIKESVREIDLACRYGGEEFALVLPETGPESAKVVAERIRKKVEAYTFKAYDETVRLTISVGAASYPQDSADFAGLIEKADAALYAAKKSGKNLVCEYKKEYNVA